MKYKLDIETKPLRKTLKIDKDTFDDGEVTHWAKLPRLPEKIINKSTKHGHNC